MALTDDQIKQLRGINTPWGEIGYITYKRTYSRRIKEDKANGQTEEFVDTVLRIVKACQKQLKVGFTPDEEFRLAELLLNLKGSVAGRFLWQVGTKTVDNLGLPSLQNCAACVVNEPIRPFTWAMEMLMLGCFHPDTLVLTKFGDKKISEITLDDLILSFDEENETFNWANPQYAGPTNSKKKDKMELCFDNGKIIKCTSDHKFLTINRGWVEAKDLNDFDDIKSFNG